MNLELPDVQAGFRKGRGTRDQIANICRITEKAREFQKNFCFIDYSKVFECVDHNKLENSSRDGNTRPPYLSHQPAGLDDSQAGIEMAGRNINLRYADDTALMAESEEELKSLLLNVKEESDKVGLKLNIQKTKIMASGPITSWKIDREIVETMTDFIFLGSKITVDDDCSCEIKRCLLLGKQAMTNLDTVLKAETLLCQQRCI